MEEITKVNQEMENVMAINKELLEGKKDTYNKDVVEAQGKVKKHQFDSIAREDDF